MKYTIYKITNKINNKTYIGKHQTQNLDDGYMGTGKLIKRAINKYGKENFTKEILFIFDNEQDMNNKEKELVVVSENTYNLCPGGHGGFGYINTNNLCDSKSNMLKCRSICHIKYGTPNISQLNKNKIISGNTFKILHKLGKINIPNWYGKTHKEETKKKISEKLKIAQQGNKNSQYGTCWITNGIENKKIRKEQLDKCLLLGYYKGRRI